MLCGSVGQGAWEIECVVVLAAIRLMTLLLLQAAADECLLLQWLHTATAWT